MSDIDDLEDAILDSATEGIDQVTVGDTTVRQMSMQDRIAAAKHIQGQAAASTSMLGMRIRAMVPGGCG